MRHQLSKKNNQNATPVKIMFDEPAEAIWAEQVGKNRYRLTNAPFAQPDYFQDDVVEAKREKGRDYPVITRLIKASGNDALGIVALYPSEDGLNAFLDKMVALGCRYECLQPPVGVITVPPSVNKTRVVQEVLNSEEIVLVEPSVTLVQFARRLGKVWVGNSANN